INPLIHIKGYGAPETKAAVERARLVMERAKTLGEPAEDPLLLFSVLYGNWVATLHGSNADVARELAAQLLALAEKQESTGPLMIGTSVMGTSLLRLGEFTQARAHHNSAVVGPVVSRLSRRGARGRRPSAQGCARDRSGHVVDVCARYPSSSPRPMREI